MEKQPIRVNEGAVFHHCLPAPSAFILRVESTRDMVMFWAISEGSGRKAVLLIPPEETL